MNEKSTVTSITGTLDEKLNVAMTATNVVVGEDADFAPNTYCAINFIGESGVKGTNPVYTSSYYFATPKANEFANVVWAVYNATDGAFHLPARQGSANAQEFKAAFKVDYSLNSTPAPELIDGDMYTFEALIKEVATTEAKPAPRKTAYDSTTAPSTRFVVFPLNGSSNITTAISEVSSAKKAKTIRYYNTLGTESSHPSKGINIMVTTHTDGTTTAVKVLHHYSHLTRLTVVVVDSEPTRLKIVDLMGGEGEEAGADGPDVDCPEEEESVGNHIVNGAPWRWEGDEETKQTEH